MATGGTKTKIHILLGPTAAGKSAVAMAVAETVGAEIISLDSMQVYRGMDIGTAKPTAAERAMVPHHLIDVRDPWQPFSTAEYLGLAEAAIEDITARGRVCLFVGGTALYAKTLLYGMFEGPSADWRFRHRLRVEAQQIGVPALHERLKQIDPVSASRIHPNDLRRIERALEIHEKTGAPPSHLRREWENESLKFEASIAVLSLPRALLHERINQRTDEMIAQGWPGEVECLLQAAGGLSREASQALGYKELAAVVVGELDLDEAVEKIKARTRQFAKRQMTWFRSFDNVQWVEVSQEDAPASIAGRVIEALGLSGTAGTENQ